MALYHDALLRALVHLGNLPEGAAPPPPPRQRVLSGDWMTAPASGLLRPLRDLGAAVRAGDSVARIEATGGDRLAVLEAPHDGVILAERNLARVSHGRPGDLRGRGGRMTVGRTPGQRVLVTGAAGGIGSAICRRLRKDGAEVIGSDVTGAPG